MAATYILPVDLVTFYDSTRVLDLLSDTTTAATLADLSSSGSAPYALAILAIRRAAGDVEQHCQFGKRYTRETLEGIITAGLAAPSDEAKQKRMVALQSLVADLTFGYLMSRRGHAAAQMRELAPRYDEALAKLEKLAAGYLVFDIDANVAAGRPVSVQMGKNRYMPSLDNKMFGVWPDGPYGRTNDGYYFGRW